VSPFNATVNSDIDAPTKIKQAEEPYQSHFLNYNNPNVSRAALSLSQEFTQTKMYVQRFTPSPFLVKHSNVSEQLKQPKI
jgi:hypothetical protein